MNGIAYPLPSLHGDGGSSAQPIIVPESIKQKHIRTVFNMFTIVSVAVSSNNWIDHTLETYRTIKLFKPSSSSSSSSSSRSSRSGGRSSGSSCGSEPGNQCSHGVYRRLHPMKSLLGLLQRCQLGCVSAPSQYPRSSASTFVCHASNLLSLSWYSAARKASLARTRSWTLAPQASTCNICSATKSSADCK